MPHSSDDSADAIAAALARLRGRRMPRPPWDPGAGPRPQGLHGGPHGHGDGPWGRGGPHHGRGHDGPPWQGAARIGGPARMRLLEALAAASHPLSVGEIADAVGVDQPRASRLVQQAFQLSLVRREADPDDARRTRVALTDAGAALVRGFRGERREAIDTALAAFSDDERADLARLLTKLADSWPR
ncbi:MarR family winged helix-turn-helix transcriptional regulator [Microbacterium sp. CFBP9034]|uniref:MarR family winged helix-turn-helix transcriptional regulator n=1 Tax=Microbacterium sp. CFBP9034 TaxID=3096540 RepID=UPI002A6A6A37|nr:MarR family winged helix-turn-helix transcriptional regulator [Microbacterium sp. CFBP9034]MDY0908196.1 MarR family winged helix-turn-helix transcriptional regulator [Microbacterium sp. CFBP9034]